MPLPCAVPGLVVARLLARRPPLCARVGAEFRRVLVQTIEAWFADAPATHDAVMRGPWTRPTPGTADFRNARPQTTERSIT